MSEGEYQEIQEIDCNNTDETGNMYFKCVIENRRVKWQDTENNTCSKE